MGIHHRATAELANRAVEHAWAVFPEWSRTPAREHVRMLVEAARILRARKMEFDAWLVYSQSLPVQIGRATAGGATHLESGSLDSWRIDGGVYGLPFGYSCWSLFYPTEGLFRSHGWKEPTRTWNEFFELLRSGYSAAGIAPGEPARRPAGLYPQRFLGRPSTILPGPAGVARRQRARTPGPWDGPGSSGARSSSRRVRTRDDAQPGWEGETAQGAEPASFSRDGRP